MKNIPFRSAAKSMKKSRFSIEPPQYIELKNREIHNRLTGTGFSAEEASMEIDTLKNLLITLEPHCNSIMETFHLLEDAIRNLPCNLKIFTIVTLLEATETETAWTNVYNSLALIGRMYFGLHYPFKDLPETVITAALEETKIRHNGVVPDKYPRNRTFNSVLPPQQLSKIYLLLIRKKIITEISESDFTYLFTGQPVFEGMKRLKWKNSRSFCHGILSGIVFTNGKFNYHQANQCIEFKAKLLQPNDNKGINGNPGNFFK